MTSVTAVYENGMLRPKQPLDLAEGEEVQVAVYPRRPALPPRPPTPEEENYVRRLSAARTIDELHEIMLTAPQTDEDYNLIRALNDNRRATGERLLFPESEEEGLR